MRPPIPRLNYQHLLYFWSVVRNGSLTKACAELHLSAPTVSAQLRTFEERLGSRLLMKSGRTLVPTEAGRLMFSYAEEIFALGADLLNALAQRPTHKPMRVVAGIDDVVPKEIAQRLVDAALTLEQPVQLMCREGTLHELLKALGLRELDLVISDSPVTPSLNLRAYNHYLGGCDVSWMAAPVLAKSLRAGFPRSLDGAPLLLPTSDTAIRRALDQWLDRHEVRPLIAGEFEDYALLREFARAGRGVAPVPSVLVKQLRQESGLRELGPARKVRGEFYAISMERNIKHPAVLAICNRASGVFELRP
jgi:LysR family transcriptional regulator, transcriptional activator of nhaA